MSPPPALPKRVLVVASEYPPATGGMQTLARMLVRGLAPRCEVHLMVQSGAGEPPLEGAASLRTFDFRMHERKLERRELREAVLDAARAVKADLVHFLNAGFALLLGERFARSGVASVVHAAGKDFTSPWIRAGFTREKASRELPAGLTAAGAVVAISRFTRDAMLRAGVTRPIRVVPPGVPPLAPRETVPPESLARVPAGAPLFLAVARLERRKGHHVLLEAFAAASRELPSARLVITGDGPERASLEALAARLGLADRVVFTGRAPDDDLLALYHAAAVFVLTPIVVDEGKGQDFEGFGIVYSEAASVGVPAIASASGGAAEAVADGETGRLVPENDVPALTQALLDLGRDERLRERLGSAARARFFREHTIEAQIQGLAPVYGEALAAAAGRG